LGVVQLLVAMQTPICISNAKRQTEAAYLLRPASGKIPMCFKLFHMGALDIAALC